MTFANTCSRPAASSKGSAAPEGTRTYLLGGNWKANGTVASAEKLIAEFNAAGPIPASAEVVVGVPFIHIPICLQSLRSDIEIAAQNCSLTGTGAYTGEICASQLKDMGVTWVILGHSERREGFGMAGEDSMLVAKKTKMALSEGLKVMLCIGEKKEEREAGTTMDVCAEQLKPCAEILSKEDWANVSSEFLSPIFCLLVSQSVKTSIFCSYISTFSCIRACLGHWNWSHCHARNGTRDPRQHPSVDV